MKPKRFANLTSVCFPCCIFSLPVTALSLYSSYKRNYRIRIYHHHFLVVSATFVQFCVFVHSCCIGDLRFFRTGIFFDRAFYSVFVFSATLQNFSCRITKTKFFSQLCVIFKYFFCVFNIPVLLSECNHFCNRIYLEMQKILTLPQRHHLSS